MIQMKITCTKLYIYDWLVADLPFYQTHFIQERQMPCSHLMKYRQWNLICPSRTHALLNWSNFIIMHFNWFAWHYEMFYTNVALFVSDSADSATIQTDQLMWHIIDDRTVLRYFHGNDKVVNLSFIKATPSDKFVPKGTWIIQDVSLDIWVIEEICHYQHIMWWCDHLDN